MQGNAPRFEPRRSCLASRSSARRSARRSGRAPRSWARRTRKRAVRRSHWRTARVSVGTQKKWPSIYVIGSSGEKLCALHVTRASTCSMSTRRPTRARLAGAIGTKRELDYRRGPSHSNRAPSRRMLFQGEPRCHDVCECARLQRPLDGLALGLLLHGQRLRRRPTRRLHGRERTAYPGIELRPVLPDRFGLRSDIRGQRV